MLAVFRRRHPDELRADFQQYYNLNIDDMGRAYSVRHAAALAAQLPRCSRTLTAENPESGWGELEELLMRVEHNTRIIAWQRTKDGAEGKRFPKPLKEAPENQDGRTTRGDAYPVEEYARILSLPRREVDKDGN